jgi:large subunit ribosomal protein L10
MPKQEKLERVAAIKERIDGSDALLLTEYRGLTVSDITILRRSLAEGGTSFAVVKNTLMRRAVADSDLSDLDVLLVGPSAVAFVSGDAVTAAKKVVDAAKRFPTLVLKGGYMEGRVLNADEARALADLESRDVMLSKVAGMLKGEMSRAAAMFVAAQSRFVSLLEAYKDKLPAEENPAAEEPVAEESAAQAAPAAEDAAEPESETPAEPTEESGTAGSEQSPDESPLKSQE